MFLWQEKMLIKIDEKIRIEKDVEELKVFKKKLEHFIHFDRTLGNPEYKEYQEKLEFYVNEISKLI